MSRAFALLARTGSTGSRSFSIALVTLSWARLVSGWSCFAASAPLSSSSPGSRSRTLLSFLPPKFFVSPLLTAPPGTFMCLQGCRRSSAARFPEIELFYRRAGSELGGVLGSSRSFSSLFGKLKLCLGHLLLTSERNRH